MKTESKIFLEKDHGVDFAMDQLLDTMAVKVVLNIPRHSVLGQSVHNFQILKREAETASKEIVVESVDEHVLELASLAGIPALNPVFKTKERIVTDIFPRGSEPEYTRAKKKSEAKKAKKKKEEEEEDDEEEEEDNEDEKNRNENEEIAEFGDERDEESDEQEEDEYVPMESPRNRRRLKRGKRGKLFVFAGSFVAILAAAFVVLTYLLPHVTIQVSIKKTTAAFSHNVLVSTAIASSSFSGDTLNLPGQILTASSNVSLHFASGTQQYVETKASGILTVYNSYSSSPQTLIATTRFVSPEGKLFRSTKRIVVPGEKTASGTATPGSATVEVVAAEPGTGYNVGPSTGWTIPGLKGTALYDKFSAAALTPMTGGFVGTTTVPTKDDLANAKNEATQKLENVLMSQLALLSSQDLKALPQSSSFDITTENVTPSKDGSGFDVYAAGSVQQLAFDESMFKNAILGSAADSASGTMKIDQFDVSYSTTTPDFAKGTMSFTATGTLVYEPNIDFNKVRSEIAGMSATALKSTIFALPGLQQANVSFWPFWVSNVPKNPSNINIEVK